MNLEFDVVEKLEPMATKFMGDHSVPCLSVAFGSGKGRFAHAFGFANVETKKTATADSRFRIASISKPITSAAIFKLIEKGKLKLTDHIFGTGSVLGNDFGSAPFAAYIEEITLLHLLTHTCGGWGNTGNDPMFSHPRFDHKRLIVETIANHPLQFQPGQHYSYSNFGYCILGRVIEKLSGESYSNFVQTEVLKPCGASGMQIAGNTLADIAVNEVHYYGQGGQNPYNLKVSRMDSHGGWIATASDLVSFALGVDGFPTPPDILSSQSIKTISKGSTVYPKYGCGWSISPTGNCWHMGSLPGTCTILVRTSRGISWAGLTNTRTVDQKPMTDDLDLLMWKMMRPITEAGRV